MQRHAAVVVHGKMNPVVDDKVSVAAFFIVECTIVELRAILERILLLQKLYQHADHLDMWCCKHRRSFAQQPVHQDQKFMLIT
jgi:hypothetical protein